MVQIPAPWRTDVLISIDGAGASHDVIDYLTSLNTAPEHGRRGRRVEYSIGWPVDDRTVAAIEQLRERDWGTAVHADGALDPAAQVTDLTGILRHGPGGDRLATWPADMRVMARRTPRPVGKPAKLGLGVRRVRHQHACGARNLPSIDYGRNAAWLQLAAPATSLTAWLRHSALGGDLAKASTKTLRFRILSTPARLGDAAEDPHVARPTSSGNLHEGTAVPT
ncbi:MAG: hypothetical protein ACRDQY_12230 [Pseudonocardiaceae bacterium]